MDMLIAEKKDFVAETISKLVHSLAAAAQEQRWRLQRSGVSDGWGLED